MQYLEILTIGLPFCAFKCLTGLHFRHYPLLVLGVIDFFINLINLISLVILKKRVLDACFLSFLVRLIKKPTSDAKSKWQDFGNSLDVLLSFILVAFVIGTGAIGAFGSDYLMIWNVAVVLNVLGAGSSRLTASIKNLKPV